jgi:tritrans,polycis-undecaprenyl-diphosphate synthase [geranylgeranyl-diphosphate specific]
MRDLMKLRSVAIIPDGNRRFAKKNSLSVRHAYSSGFEKVEQVLEWAEKADISTVTFWALSLENFQKRSKLELRILFSLMRHKLSETLKNGVYEKNKIRVKFFGKTDLLPIDLQKKIKELETRTQNFDRTLGIAVAYSGREEILSAAKRIAIDFYGSEKRDKLLKLNEADFEKYLYMPTAPDLIIRTGEVSRLSGFLPWQTAYSELFFSKRLWPEFTETDFNEAVEFYNETQRRFGK